MIGNGVAEDDGSGAPSGSGKLAVPTDEATALAQKHIVWKVEDPSDYRPETIEMENIGKEKEKFRIFNEEDTERYEVVKRTYTNMHTYQTVEFVKEMHKKYDQGGRAKMTIMDAISLLDNLVDESDPDTAEPNSFHMFQTAERTRLAHPDKDWFHLTGLIHDLGKIIALWGEPQWAVVGDTFPVGCAYSDKCVFYDTFKNNPDHSHPVYSTKYGIYKPNCGLHNTMISYGHDEYLYQLLVRSGCSLPLPSLYIVRFHSLYPWHTGGAYDHLCTEEDRKMMSWVQEFNKFDLYSKADIVPDIEAVRPYYQSLIDKYFPGQLNW